MEINEGDIKIEIIGGKLSKKLKGFYNPEMKLNRDIAVEIVKKLKPDKILDANAATGIRSIRFYNEANAKSITACEIDSESFLLLKKNLNENKINAINADANEVMDKNNFDYIDIDPYGSPVPFLKSAVKSINNNGIIALTATDIGCLSGTFVKTCIRKYSSRPMPCMFGNELGVRILIYSAIKEAKLIGKCLIPVFCHAGRHYYRAYLKNVNKAAVKTGFLLLCRKCLNFHGSEDEIKVCCMKNMDFAGPLWLGSLFNKEFVNNLVPYIREESKIDSIGYYDMHYMAKKLKISKIPKIEDSLLELAKSGFKASRTHFCLQGIRTNASTKEFINTVFRQP